MKIKDIARFEEEDIYFMHKVQGKAFMRLKGEDEIYYAKSPGKDQMRIEISSKSVTDAWIFGTEITKEEYAKF